MKESVKKNCVKRLRKRRVKKNCVERLKKKADEKLKKENGQSSLSHPKESGDWLNQERCRKVSQDGDWLKKERYAKLKKNSQSSLSHPKESGDWLNQERCRKVSQDGDWLKKESADRIGQLMWQKQLALNLSGRAGNCLHVYVSVPALELVPDPTAAWRWCRDGVQENGN